jgi:hypothetical protein
MSALIVGGCLTDFGPATATFDGSGCTYDGIPDFGPVSHDDEDLVTFTFDNRSSGVAGLGIWKIPDNIVIDDFNDIGASGPGVHLDPDVDLRGVGEAPGGESASVTVRLDEPGWWLLNCFTDDSDYPANTFLVATS